MKARRLAQLDPTDPNQWLAQQARGRESFQLRFGLAVGVLVAVAYDFVLLAARHDLPVFFSAQHALQMLIITVSVGLAAGLFAGRVLWRVGERRYADAMLTREFLQDENVPRSGQRQ